MSREHKLWSRCLLLAVDERRFLRSIRTKTARGRHRDGEWTRWAVYTSTEPRLSSTNPFGLVPSTGTMTLRDDKTGNDRRAKRNFANCFLAGTESASLILLGAVWFRSDADGSAPDSSTNLFAGRIAAGCLQGICSLIQEWNRIAESTRNIKSVWTYEINGREQWRIWK